MIWFRRQLSLLDFALSSLRRRSLKNVALISVYTFLVAALASVLFFTRAMQREAGLLLEDSPEIIVQRLSAGRHDLIPARYASAIRNIKGVQEVEERLWGYYYDPGSGANFTILVPPDPQGSTPEPGWALLGNGVLRSFAARDKDSLTFRSYKGTFHTLRIKGSFSSRSELVSADLILVHRDDFMELFGFPDGLATDLSVRVRNPKERSLVAEKITQALPDTRPILRDEILRTYRALFDWRGGMILAILSSAILAFLILAWEKATGLSAEERREIGILKAIGWETSDVLLMKIWEGLSVSLSAFFLGVFLAYTHVFYLSSVLFEPVMRGWSVLYPDFSPTPVLRGEDLAALLLFTVAPYIVATLLPCWRAATMDPDAVARGLA